MSESVPDDSERVIVLAEAILDLARAGAGAYLDAGVPVDLTDANGDTLLRLAAFHGHAALVAAGADPDPGNPSARATAGFFDLPEMLVLLDPPPRSS